MHKLFELAPPNQLKNRKKKKMVQDLQPCGIQVSLTESLLFLLLKAVFMPTTIRYFRLPLAPAAGKFCEVGEPLNKDSCVALAPANSISKLEIVLPSVLHFDQHLHQY